jgi:hypothetical protein
VEVAGGRRGSGATAALVIAAGPLGRRAKLATAASIEGSRHRLPSRSSLSIAALKALRALESRDLTVPTRTSRWERTAVLLGLLRRNRELQQLPLVQQQLQSAGLV